jgi:hypothetical protein
MKCIDSLRVVFGCMDDMVPYDEHFMTPTSLAEIGVVLQQDVAVVEKLMFKLLFVC